MASITQYSRFMIKINNKTYHKNKITALFSCYFSTKIKKYHHQKLNIKNKKKP